jgi:hypothetical protein
LAGAAGGHENVFARPLVPEADGTGTAESVNGCNHLTPTILGQPPDQVIHHASASRLNRLENVELDLW